jgi:hypothetical protein
MKEAQHILSDYPDKQHLEQLFFRKGFKLVNCEISNYIGILGTLRAENYQSSKVHLKFDKHLVLK